MKEDKPIGQAIEKVISKIFSCAFCGFGVSAKNVCLSCNIQNNVGTFLNNLNKLKTAKK